MPVQNITSQDEFDNLLVENRVAVVEFYSMTSGSCRAIASVFDHCSDLEKFDHVSFFRADAGELPELSKARGITKMPTFQLYVGGDKVDEIKGSNQPALVALIEATL